MRWTKTHQAEADAIGRDVTHASNLFESPDYKAYVERMTQNTPSAQNTVIAPPSSLESKYRENATRVQEQAVVKDTTGELKQLKEVVANAASNSNLRHNEDVKELLQNNLNAEEKVIAQNLENERVKGEESKSKKIQDVFQDIKNKPISSKSTMYRAAEQVGYNAGLSNRAIDEKNIILPRYKDKDKK